MNLVLIEPEIHFNTGNVARSCVGTGSTLHLVGKLGFSLDAKEIRRSGLDYWPKLRLRLYPDFETFETALPGAASLLFFSAEAPREYWSAPYAPESYLIFGRESLGLPVFLRERYRERLYRIPHNKDIRSLNLSTAAAVVLYEALRQTRPAAAPLLA